MAGLLAFAAALTRPIGVLLVLAVGAELVRWWPRLGRGGAGGRPRCAVAAPFVGVLCFLAWSKHVVGDWWAPLRVQLQSSHHGGLSDPFATLYHDASGVLHHHVGTALHVPWVLLALAMLVVCWRRLPAPYTLFAAGVLATAVAGSNLDSFERYALSAFPLSIAAALVLTGVPARAGGPGPAGGRAGRVRPAGLPQHLGPLTAPRPSPTPVRDRRPSPGRHGGSTNLPCSWSPPPKPPSSSPARAPEG